LPYVSGPSGMANCASTIFSLLQKNMLSEDGKNFIEAMAAFIVLSGMHSYTEVYKAFNLTLKNIEMRVAKPGDVI
jgi:hypothetical protein